MKGKLHRKLEARHLSMIALGGTIGTGLFVGSGTTIALAGPLGVVIAYAVVGILAYAVTSSIGEMSTQIPASGAFCELTARIIDPALGFTLGWSYYFLWLLCVTAELSAFGQLWIFWFPDLEPWYFTLCGVVLLSIVNLFGVKIYGELEYWLSVMKLFAISVFILVGVAIVCGANSNLRVIGFRNWFPENVPGAPITDVFNVMNAFIIAFYSYSGCEIIGVTSGEAKNPNVSIPKALKGTFWRILLFYVISLTVIGLIIPMNDPGLGDTNVRTSPFTRVLQYAGLSFAPSLMNAVVLVAIFSAANGSVYTTTRTLQALAANNMAPNFLIQTNSHGVPVNSILTSLLFGALSLIGAYVGDKLVFEFLVTVMSITTLLTWSTIIVTHLRFRWAWRKQGREDADLVYAAPFYPFFDIAGLLIGILVFVFLFLDTIKQAFDWVLYSPFYIGITSFVIPYLIYKIYYRQGFLLVPVKDIDFFSNPNGGEDLEVFHIPKSDK